MSYSPELGGMAGPNQQYASADFPDAEEMRPLGAVFDIGGHGISTPYSTAVNAIVNKHSDEVKGKAAAMLNLPGGWKKRLRDFLTTKNGDLLDFLKLSVASHPVLGPAEILLRRFGNPQAGPNHPSVRDIVLDISGMAAPTAEMIMGEINGLLDVYSGEGALKNHAHHTRIIYDEYRAAGEEVLTQQAQLRAKLDKFDRIQGRISQVFEIDPNEKYPDLLEAMERYLAKVFRENAIEENYKKLIGAYRRFAVLRDVVTMSRSLLLQETEPICGICLADSVTFALTPCGHTYCQTCVRRQHAQCFMCRAAFKDKVKLFFG